MLYHFAGVGLFIFNKSNSVIKTHCVSVLTKKVSFSHLKQFKSNINDHTLRGYKIIMVNVWRSEVRLLFFVSCMDKSHSQLVKNGDHHEVYLQTWLLLTCEEPEGWFGLGAQNLDPAEEGEGDAVGGLGERLDVPTAHGFRVPELAAGEGQDVEVRRSQFPVELLQSSVVALRLLAVTRHVYNQRRLQTADTRRGGRLTYQRRIKHNKLRTFQKQLFVSKRSTSTVFTLPIAL